MLRQTQQIWERFHLVRRAQQDFIFMKDFSSFLAENDYLVQEYMARDLISEDNPLILLEIDVKSWMLITFPCRERLKLNPHIKI